MPRISLRGTEEVQRVLARLGRDNFGRVVLAILYPVFFDASRNELCIEGLEDIVVEYECMPHTPRVLDDLLANLAFLSVKTVRHSFRAIDCNFLARFHGLKKFEVIRGWWWQPPPSDPWGFEQQWVDDWEEGDCDNFIAAWKDAMITRAGKEAKKEESSKDPDLVFIYCGFGRVGHNV